MGNKFDEMRQAISEARITFEAADSIAEDMANLLRGRLRMVSSGSTLCHLKRELRNFNMHTREWKE